MDITPSIAAQSYEMARSAVGPQPQTSPDGGMVKWFDSFVDTLATGEETARVAMTGGADPHMLVQALASTQLAVETVTTVRNKVVEAYQEILRMPV